MANTSAQQTNSQVAIARFAAAVLARDVSLLFFIGA
jgi:hypothetical protein